MVLMPRSASRRWATGPTPHMRPTGNGSRNSRSAPRLDDDQPVGLGDLRRDLGQVLGAGHADRDRQAELARDPPAQQGGDRRRRAEEVGRAGHVEERLVDRDALHRRRDVPEDVHDLVGEALVR